MTRGVTFFPSFLLHVYVSIGLKGRLNSVCACCPPSPLQISRLTAPCWLELQSASHDPASLAASLAQLAGHLTRLDLWEVPNPASMSALTAQRHLRLHPQGGLPLDTPALLQPLSQLTALLLFDVRSDLLPACLNSLPQLQRCMVRAPSPPGLGPHPLLPGPWQNSLRWLSANWSALGSSAAVLAAASQLEFVGILSCPDHECTEQADWEAFWGWAATHPPLRRLSLDFMSALDADVDVHVFNAMMRLWQRRPSLHVTHTGALGHLSSYQQISGWQGWEGG